MVAAMATDAWQTARSGVSRLFRRGDQAQQAAIEAQLESNAALVSQTESPERARRMLISVWQLQLEDLLRQFPDAGDELQSLVSQIKGELPESTQNWVQTLIAKDNATIFAAQGGNVNVNQWPEEPPQPVVDPPGDAS